MTTESEDYHSMTELECFMQPAHDSDVEIKFFGKDGAILSGISELEDDIDDMDNINEPIDHDNFYIDNPSASTSDLYYILHDQHKSSKSKLHSRTSSTKSSSNSSSSSSHHKRSKSKNIKHLIKNLCEAPHLYIQQRQSCPKDSKCSSLYGMINYLLYIDEYLSYKYFYELSIPLIIEIIVIFGTFMFNQISVLLLIVITTCISQEIQFGVFIFLTSLTSFVIMQFCTYFKIFPFRSLPNVINNTDEYGYNIKRSINIRYLYYKNKDMNVSSFPDYNCLNVFIFTLSWHLYTNQWLVFMIIPYILFARCYFAFNYIFDGIWSGIFGVLIVYGLRLIIPQTFLIISDEIIREITLNMFS